MLFEKLKYPEKIICLTEEPVELLFALGAGDKIIGRSAFVKRPEAAKAIPIISKFTSSNIDKIIELKPELVLGFSDIQKDIARDLIGAGINVFISNQRSLEQILQYILSVSAMVGKASEGQSYVSSLQALLEIGIERGKKLKKRPKIYFEEWDEPRISGIKWVSQIIEICGGVDIMSHYSSGSLAHQRMPSDQEIIEANPDIILACWCGKKVKKDLISNRKGWRNIEAVKRGNILELEPEIFLQPGPAPIVDGIKTLSQIFEDWDQLNNKGD